MSHSNLVEPPVLCCLKGILMEDGATLFSSTSRGFQDFAVVCIAHERSFAGVCVGV